MHKFQGLEKKAKKKAGASGAALDSQQPNETETSEEKAPELEKTEEKVEAPVPRRNKVQKENVIRYRPQRKGPDSLPRAILKRKKATNYWPWAASAALALVMLLAAGYIYLQ